MSSGDIVRFGKYRLMQKIAAGGMGEVHLAKLKGPSGFEKLVVIKRLLDHRKNEQKYIDMFFSEARVAAQLNHSNIVQIYEVGNYEGVHYIAMEYVQGKSLRRIIDATQERYGELPVAYTVQIMVELCAGLAFAHDARHLSGASMGLIHRDINPHNVLVSYLGEVKVIDFGIAKSELTLEQTQAGTIKGTVVYMSPEQSSGYKLDKRSDLFSVGICLYEALTGTNPFHKDTLSASLDAIRHATYPALQTVRPDLGAFAPVVTKALARHPDDRYANCGELAEALVALQQRGAVPKAAIPLNEFLRNLFADEIAEEERLLSQTELAEIPLMGATDTIHAPTDRSPTLISDDKTVMDHPNHSDLDAEPTVASVESPMVQLGISATATRLEPQQRPIDRFRQQMLQLWGKTWVRYAAATLGAAVLYAVLAVLIRPVSTPDIPHTPLPPPPVGPHLIDTNNVLPAPTADPAQPLTPDSPGPHIIPAGPHTPSSPRPGPTLPRTTPPTGDIDRPPRRIIPPHHNSKSHPPSRLDSAKASMGTLRIQVEPPTKVLFNNSPLVNNTLRLKVTAGTFQIGSGADPDTDPYVAHVHFRIENKEIFYGIDAEPWANVLGAGGINLGRTPVQGVPGSPLTVFELQNPKIDRKVRITVHFGGLP